MKTIHVINSHTSQQGAMIVVTLIILLIVSMLGMSTMDTTGLEMRMATNTRDQQMAFEAAEYTLSWVENDISLNGGFSDESITDTDCGNICFDDDCSDGYCFEGSDPLDWSNCELDAPATEPYQDEDIWDDADYHRTLVVPNVNVTTKYIIEFRCYTAIYPNQLMSVTNYTRMFRITAFATGPGGRGKIMLRSTYKLL